MLNAVLTQVHNTLKEQRTRSTEHFYTIMVPVVAICAAFLIVIYFACREDEFQVSLYRMHKAYQADPARREGIAQAVHTMCSPQLLQPEDAKKQD